MSQTNPKYKRLESLLSEAKPAEPDPARTPATEEALKAQIAKLEAENKLLQRPPEESYRRATAELKTQPLPLPAGATSGGQASFSNEPPAGNTTSPARTAFLIAAAIAAVHFVAVAYYLYLGRTTGIAQFNTLAVVSVALGVIIALGAELSRRGQITLGMILALGSLAVSYPPVSAALVGGLGLVLGLALMAVGPMSAFQVLPRKSGRVMTIITFLSGLATLLLDVFGSTARPSLQGIVIQLLAVSVVGLVIFFIIRQFRDYPLRTKLVLGFVSVIVLAGLVAVIAIQQQFRAAEQTAVTEAGHVAETVGTVLSRGQSDLQELIQDLHDTQQREVKVVDLNKKILASAILSNIGTIYDADQNEEVAATLTDGQPRAFLETSAEYPQGIKQVVVPVRDEYTEIIIGAVLLDYNQALQQASFDGAERLTRQFSSILASDPAGLQNFISVLFAARGQDIVVVDLQKRILADSRPENTGSIYTRDLGGEVAATIQDGGPRTFTEVSVDHPRGIQQVVIPIRGPGGQIIGITILGTNPETEQDTISQTIQMAEAISTEVSQSQARMQELILQISETQERDVVIVDFEKRILGDAVPENIGLIFEHDQNGEVAATLSDGQPRTFVEVSEDYPQGIKQVVIPTRDESGTIVGAVILDYTSLYEEVQQSANAASRTLVIFGLAGLLVAFVISQFISTSVANPIAQLSDAAQKIGSGLLDTPIPLRPSNDEVGILTTAFENMTAQLRGLIGSLEGRVAERTQDLEVAAEVSRVVSEKTANIDGLLKDAAELIAERFHLYYTQIYLADTAGHALILRAGSGEVGAELQRRGHRLPLNPGSINGRAAVEKRSVVVEDTAASIIFRPNTLLPNTRSEMSVPLIAGGKVVGVLDMQSAYAGALNETNRTVFEALAGQLAIAIQNAALFAETEQALNEVESQARRLTRSGWIDYLDAIRRPEQIGFTFDQSKVTSLEDAEVPSTSNGHALTAPIAVTGEPVGTLSVELEGQNWSAETKEFVNAVARQVAQRVENLRLLESTERYRAEAENAVRRLTREGWKDYANTQAAEGPSYLYDLKEVKPLDRDLDQLVDSSDIVLPLKVRDETVGRLSLLGLNPEDKDALELANTVAERLSAHIENLRLAEQIEKRASELATVADVSTTTSNVLEPDKLLQSVVDLTKEQFSLYHSHVYLVDESKNALVLSAGAGEVGQKLVAAGHSIPTDAERSLVARAARERKAVVVNDVRSEPDFLPNPLLPETRSEMAVPMIVGDKVLGVFDVQSNILNHFTEEDTSIYTTLTSQVAVSLQNARLYVEQTATVTQLRELDRLKNSFLANMSHELRTPLNSILGFSDVMLEGLDGPLTDNMDNDLKLIQKNGQHLLHLINDVLDMAKIESGRMNLTPEKFKVHEIFEEVTSITSTLASERNLALFVEDDSDREVEIFADRTRIRQVMINLVNNSIKFTEQGQIAIHAARRDEHVLIRVKDTGIGIAADKLEEVFQEFAQVDSSTTRKAGGTGLGLPISRKLIEMHGGRLWAESSGIANEGSTFYVELPLEARLTEPVEKLVK